MPETLESRVLAFWVKEDMKKEFGDEILSQHLLIKKMKKINEASEKVAEKNTQKIVNWKNNFSNSLFFLCFNSII